MTIIKTIIDELYELLRIEFEQRSVNRQYINYLNQYYTAESDDLNMMRWLDYGLESLRLWDNLLDKLQNNLVNISVSDFVSELNSYDIVGDLGCWSLNAQQYRSRFVEFTIEDVIYRIEHLYLRLSSIKTKYNNLTKNVG